jgi:hypothetical protein
MRLPGLPTTKANVIARAEKEGWFYEEAKGVGGTRRLYQVPEQYLPTPAVSDQQRKAELHEMSGGLYRACDGGWSDPAQARELSRPGLEGAFEGVEELREPYDKSTQAPAAHAIAAGRSADAALLAVAIRAFEEFAAPRQLEISPERKASIIAVLYDYLAKGARDSDVETFLKAVA